MDIRKLQRVVVDALEDVKAQNIKVFNTIGLSDLFDRVVLASGTSNRQTRALAYRVAQQVKEAGGHVVSVEGADAGEWVLVDLGDLVVHVMQPAIREYYALEEIWGGKPVRVKIAESGARRIVAHAEAPEREPAAAVVPARSTAAKAPARSPAAKARAGSTARKTLGKSHARKRSTAIGAPAGKTGKRAAPRKAAARKGAARKKAASATGRKKARSA
jgi:ribosome-associated protein